ncbi:MAG: ribosome silencing factor [Cyanobacteria bacterium J083]|nr:MAG: ribosome silencing factor [Cyanobacteria bacterium J083]
MNQTAKTNQIDSLTFAQIIATAADERKAGDIILLDVADISYLTDYFVIVTGYSTTQARAICDSIDQKVSKELGREPINLEGKQEANWILQDYGEVIVHIFLPEAREFYNLEAFWGHARTMEFIPANQR